MPGKFVKEVHIYKCGQRPDGSSIFCTKFGYAKIPFLLEANSPSDAIGWQEAGVADIHVPLTTLIAALEGMGISVSYDSEDLARRFAPRPDEA